MNDGIRIRLSAGLIVVAIIHAVLLGAVFTAIRPCPTERVDDDDLEHSRRTTCFSSDRKN